jgi:hypothetical protein
MGYLNGNYWIERSDYMYYKYIDLMVRVVGSGANSIIDVGSGNSPYLEWFDWIEEKTSIDIKSPYSSARVQSITANILDYDFRKKYDICLCLQVLEHVQYPQPFAHKLFELSDTVIISVPYKWPKGTSKGHVHDPLDEEKLEKFTGKKPNFSVVVIEPFVPVNHARRLIAIYSSDPKKNWRSGELKERKLRDMGKSYFTDKS